MCGWVGETYLFCYGSDLCRQFTRGSKDEELGVGVCWVDASEEGEEVGEGLARA